MGFATVAAFDSGNLVSVAKALHEKYPEKQIIIAGDDDRHLELTHGINTGRCKAEEAARAVGGKVLLPIFAPNENSYPAGLEAVTPQKFRKGHLSDKQHEALAKMKQYRVSARVKLDLGTYRRASVNRVLYRCIQRRQRSVLKGPVWSCVVVR